MKKTPSVLAFLFLAARFCFAGGGSDNSDCYPREVAITPFANGYSKNPSLVWTFPKDHDFTLFWVVAFVDRNGDGRLGGLEFKRKELDWFLGEYPSSVYRGAWPSHAPESVLGSGGGDLILHEEITPDNRYGVARTYKAIGTAAIPPEDRDKPIVVVVSTLTTFARKVSVGDEQYVFRHTAYIFPSGVTFRLDESAPLVSPQSASYVWPGMPLRIPFSCTDAASGVSSVTVTRDGAAVDAFGGDHIYANARGTYAVMVRDGTGNASTASLVVRDGTPPTLTLGGSVPPLGNGTNFTVTAADLPGDSGVNISTMTCAWTLDGVSFSSGTFSASGAAITVSKPFGAGLPSGNYRWTFTLSDFAGHAAAPLTVTQRLFLNPPAIQFPALPAPAPDPDGRTAWYAARGLPLKAVDDLGRTHAAFPSLMKVSYSTDGKAVGDATKTWSRIERAGATWSVGGFALAGDGSYGLLDLGEGKRRVDLAAEDEAGNRCAESIDFNVDTVAPTLALTVGDASSTGSAGEAFYLKEAANAIGIRMTDATSGMAKLSYAADGVTAAPLWSKNPQATEAVTATTSLFTPAEGEHAYVFTATDAAGHTASASVVVLYDPLPIAEGDLSFRLTDRNSALTGRSDASVSGSIGNFGDLSLSVDAQAAGSAQPAAYLWTLDGVFQADGQLVQGSGTGTPYTVVLASGASAALSEGSHTVTVTVTDQAGNVTTKAFAYTVDSTAPAITKGWIRITDDGGEAATFTVNPVVSAGDEAAITVYSTHSSPVLLWSNGTVTGTGGSAATGSFSLSNGVGAIRLRAVDVAGNASEKSYSVVRPAVPAAPALNKAVSGDYASFAVTVADPAGAVSVGGLSYAVRYAGVGVTGADGNAEVSGATVVTAAGEPLGWNAAALGSGGAKAYEAGKLGYLKAWAVLSAPEVPESSDVVALSKNGAATVYRIPNSPPRFTGEGEWPVFLGSAPSVSYPTAVDPDGHTIRYRFRTTSGSAVWHSSDYPGTPPAVDWASRLSGGGTVSLQAWAGEGTAWEADVAEASRSYAAGMVDFAAPGAAVDSLWSASGAWTRASTYALALTDSGASGLSGATAVYTPLAEDGSIDTASGRGTVETAVSGIAAGAGSVALPVSVPEALSGRYRLTVAVTDRAGNKTVASPGTARFDRGAPALSAATVVRPYDLAAKRYLADALGALSVRLGASDALSGLGSWGYQPNGGEWVWSRWIGEVVSFTPPWGDGESLAVRFAVRDKVGNESGATDWIDCAYDPEAPEFTLAVSGIPATGFVGSLGSLSATVSPSTVQAQWRLIGLNADGTETASAAAASWSALAGAASLWNDGGRYRIEATATNGNGVSGSRRSAPFTLDRSAPAVVIVALVPPTDRSRTAYYRNESFSATVQGGGDDHSPVSRKVTLYQRIGGTRTDLVSVSLGTGESLARLTWGDNAIDWTSGSFFVEAMATNAAGASTTSGATAVSVGGEGMSVYVPPYNGGEGSLALSWKPGADAEVGSYRYRLWTRASSDALSSDAPLGAETEIDGGSTSALVDLSAYGLTDGMALYATVAAYGSDGSLLCTGASTLSVVDSGAPELAWTAFPEAVTSSRVWARFSVLSSASGAASAKWLVERKAVGGEWEILPYSAAAAWRPAPGNSGGELSADLTDKCATGDLIRITVLVENGVGRAAQITTAALPVDDTPPPVPLVLDQGDAVNHIRQALRFNWKLSEADGESGTAAYRYGWFLKGEATGPASWTDAAAGTLAATVDLSSSGAPEGKVAVLAVKAVNKAGLDTIGYSDGILLDSTAPLVFDMKVYASAAKTVELLGYAAASSFSGKSVFLSVDATDGESWVAGGDAAAYTWNEGEWVQEGTPLSLSGSTATFSLPSSSSGFAPGSRWRFKASAKDAAGNASAAAISDGFVVEGSVPCVTGLRGFLDAATVNLSWDVDSAEDLRWVSHYAVTARWGSSSRTVITSARTASFVWGAGGLGLTNGDAVQFTVSAVSYTAQTRNSSQSADYRLDMVIDAAPPELDGAATAIPTATGATHFYDRVEGHLVYRSNRGASSLQWSAILVPGETPLTGWEEKRWTNQWDFQKTFSEIDSASLSAWHGKRIRLRFRAANGMGIWSEATVTGAVAVDATDPETVALTRENGFSNQTNEVSGWTLSMSDADSGIMSYMTALVPTAQVTGVNTAGSYAWPQTAVAHPAGDRTPGAALTVSLAVPLASAGEGRFTPLARIRNGSGRWVVRAGNPITIDRTSPTVTGLSWTGAPAQSLSVDGKNLTVWVSNGPTQDFSVAADEMVKWTVAGLSPAGLMLPASGYAAAVASTLDFSGRPDGELYPVTFTLEDQAGNTAVAESVLRYNKAPAVSMNAAALTVRPGAVVRLEDLVSVTDDEGPRTGDYSLTFTWTPGNGTDAQTWSGGSALASVFGVGAGHTTAYAQESKTAQISAYTGILVVRDRYGKTTTTSLPMTVENTRVGALLVDEHWSGPFRTRGWITVPSGRTLTLDGAEVTVEASLGSDGTMLGGIAVLEGGTLLISPSTPGARSEVTTGVSGVYWDGIRVRGTVSGIGVDLSYARRALVLEASGIIRLSQSDLRWNAIGLHLLGGSLEWNGWTVANNEEYGVKEDGAGTYTMKNSDFQNNGVDYYRHEVSDISIDELNGLAGNGGNREVK